MRSGLWHYCAVVFVTIISSCAPDYYVAQADSEVYALLSRAEGAVFKKNQDYSIRSTTDARSIRPKDLLAISQKEGESVLSIDDAILYGIKNGQEYQKRKERLYLTALTLTESQADYENKYFSRFNPQMGKRGESDAKGELGISQGLSRALKTGGSVSLVLANDFLRFFTGDPQRQARSVFSLNIAQPLLRGVGKEIAMEQITQNTRNVVYALRDYNQFQQDYSRSIVVNYLKILQQKVTVENQFKNFQSRQENTAYLQARSIDRANPQEVGDSIQGELQAKNSWINAKSRYQTLIDEFKLLIGVPASMGVSLMDSELDQIAKLGLQPLDLSHSRAMNLALRNRLPLLNEIDRFEDSKRQIGISENQLKADVEFFATSSLSSSGQTNYENFNFNDAAVEVGLQIDLPVNRTRERNNYRATLIQYESDIRSLKFTFDELQNLIKQGTRELDQFKQNYEIQMNAVQLAERRVEANKLRLQAGSLIFRRLSESQDALISAQNAKTAALVNYQQSRLEFFSNLGLLDIESKQFWLKRNPTRKGTL